MSPWSVIDACFVFDCFQGDFFHLVRESHQLCIPDLIFDEFEHSPSQEQLLDWGIPVVPLTSAQVTEVEMLYSRNRSISTKDLSAFVLCKDNGYTLLTSEWRLSDLARNAGITVIGSIAMLQRCVAEERLPAIEAASAIEKMLDGGRRLPKDTCRELLELWRAGR